MHIICRTFHVRSKGLGCFPTSRHVHLAIHMHCLPRLNLNKSMLFRESTLALKYPIKSPASTVQETGQTGQYYSVQKMCLKLRHIYFAGTSPSGKHNFLQDNLIDAGTNVVHLLHPRHLIASLQFLRDAHFSFICCISTSRRSVACRLMSARCSNSLPESTS